jgi:hypothetical protein
MSPSLYNSQRPNSLSQQINIFSQEIKLTRNQQEHTISGFGVRNAIWNKGFQILKWTVWKLNFKHQLKHGVGWASTGWGGLEVGYPLG